ncbi:hypothetical protein FOC4_g10007683 [Fusarium odoratissimum]|uniref:LysM domain-containing protein n=1 Tax=Fusarium oxysporum f. sp. cubense (strain race 4) TaxID=2502994 RepID=N1RTK1_FUSC4|nr:hypothetical protein FOC4_g10007683 [Fusarium odoratissimum]
MKSLILSLFFYWAMITAVLTQDSKPGGPVHPGQPSNCIAWHTVKQGDDCETVPRRYYITKKEFLAWNPTVSKDYCSGLFVGYRYCVGVKSNSTGNLEWETSMPPFTPPPEPTSHKPTKLTPSGSNFTPTPAHGLMPTDCVNYHQAEADESCRDILKTYNYLSKDQFFKYNPSELPMPPTVTTTPSDVPRGSPKDCKAWYYTTGGETCEQLANMFGTFNIKGFIAMNPSVLDDCGDIEDNTWYCVAGPDTPTTRTADVTAPTRPATAMPTQSGIATGCERYWLVSKKDTCKSIRRANSILLDKLLTWNPALGSTCSGLKPDSYVCVNVGA